LLIIFLLFFPRNESSELKESIILADQWTTAIALTGIMSLLTAGTETGGGQYKDFLRNGIHFPYTFRIADNGNLRLTHP